MRRIIATALCATLAACGGGGGEPSVDNAAYQAPERAPMALDPDPPMTGADIDAIVNQTRGQVAAPDAGGNAGDAAANAAGVSDNTTKGN